MKKKIKSFTEQFEVLRIDGIHWMVITNNQNIT